MSKSSEESYVLASAPESDSDGDMMGSPVPPEEPVVPDTAAAEPAPAPAAEPEEAAPPAGGEPAEEPAEVPTADGKAKADALFEGDETKAAAVVTEEEPVETSTKEAPPAPTTTLPAAGVGAGAGPSAGAGAGAGAGFAAADGKTCPMVCSPGLQKVAEWAQFKPVLPGALILSTTITGYTLHTYFGMSHSAIVAVAFMLAITLSGLIKLHNKYLDPLPLLSVPMTEKCIDSIAEHATIALKGAVAQLNAALAWKCPFTSGAALAHLWLLYRFNCFLTCPTTFLVAVLSVFTLPMLFTMLKPQLSAIYTANVQPVLAKVLAQVHTVVVKVSGLDSAKRMQAGGVTGAVLLIVWYLFSSYISLWCIFSCAATTSSFALVALQHRKCFAACCSGSSAGCPAVSFGGKKKAE